MLTKDLVKFKSRGQSIVPVYLANDDQEALNLCTAMIDILRESLGESEFFIENRLDELERGTRHTAVKGLRKVIRDLCEFGSPPEDAEDFRWKCFATSEEMRVNAKLMNASKQEFQDAVAKKLNKDFLTIQEELFKDLPGNAPLKDAPSISANDAINRYNIGLVQGLLLKSEQVEITLDNSDVASVRALLRQAKFRGLMIESLTTAEQPAVATKGQRMKTNPSKTITWSLSGPLAIFSNANSYGLKLALFFPTLLNTKNWSLEARVAVKTGAKTLVVTPEDRLQPIYAFNAPYIPDEFATLIASFTERNQEFNMTPGGPLLQFEGGKYAIPDFTIVAKDNPEKVRYIELFHRWNSSHLKNRVELIKKCSARSDDVLSRLIIGVDHELTKENWVCDFLNEHNNHQTSQRLAGVFRFRGVPSVGTISNLLN